MAEEQHIVRNVSWSEIFSFSHIFKSFKMAVHPGKLMLALVGIALTIVVGYVLMDPIYSAFGCRVRPGETWAYWTAGSRAEIVQAREKWLDKDRVDSVVGLLVADTGLSREEAVKKADKHFSDAIGMLQDKAKENYGKAQEAADKAWQDDEKAAKEISDEDRKSEMIEQARQRRLESERRALQAYILTGRNLDEKQGQGIFDAFMDWEMHCLRNAIGSVRRLNFSGGASDLLARRGSMVPAAYKAGALLNAPPFNASTNQPEGFGAASWLMMMAWGLWWMFAMFPIYTIVFIVVVLAIWSVLGGAICRMAALHAAREEKIGLPAAIKFGVVKLRHFFVAPVLPIGIIIFLGLWIALGGLIGNIGYFGELFVAIGFPLALLLSAIIAFLTIGLMVGWPMMWPTIAVEGSDSFDALSRSFSYVFNRPFRYGLYWLVASIYGTLCYLFVRLFAFLTLKATHCWADWGMSIADRPNYAVGAHKLDVMWAAPTFDSFHGPMQTEAMSRWEMLAGYLIAFWVYLVAGLVLAFVITFFFSAATNIYYLLRQKVDATDLDDVYVEEEEEEIAAPEEAPTGVEEQAVASPSVERITPEEPGGGQTPPADEEGEEQEKPEGQ